MVAGRVLTGRDLPALFDLLERDPVANVFVASRVEALGLDPTRLGAEIWPHVVDGRLAAACYAGANLIPIGADEHAIDAFAERARSQGRRCSSLVGPADMVMGMWHRLETDWGSARDIRDCQPLLAISGSPTCSADPEVRRVTADEIDVLLPASVAMFTEEVGISPVTGDGGALYRSRVAEIVHSGRSFARIEGGRVLFKAEVGAATRTACQIQGVWVEPSRRGEGLSLGGMAAVVQACHQDIAPVTSLYVNDFNTPARRAYEAVGFRQVGTFASILF